MTTSTLIFSVLVFALVVVLSLAALSQWLPNPGRDRLARLTANRPDQTEDLSAWQRAQTRLLSALLWFGPWAAGLSGGEGSTPSALRLRFGHAGWRSPMALQIYFISKTVLTLLLPILAWGAMETQAWATENTLRMALVIFAAALGYYLPDVLLNWRIQRRQLALSHAFPDALDLLRLCVQAGLGLDAAIDRVGREMRHARPELSEEFALTGLALRGGSSRADALRNLSQRVGLKDIDAMVSMLIQADRFGTSVSESLAVHAEALRTQRRLRAEEAGAKLPVKLLIPLIFCVFPSLLTVLLGPVVVTLAREFVQTV
ncbi:type II secretion system F family protein [Limnohabitans sp.]|uniref:type II secretion system F family protein n=1 Tax=Limnohabitans sp. TaxID=1907725 RepID=UPI003341ACAF